MTRMEMIQGFIKPPRPTEAAPSVGKSNLPSSAHDEVELGSDSDSDADSSLMLTADDETFLKDRLPQYLTDDDDIEYDPY